jgi:hypothetical protein
MVRVVDQIVVGGEGPERGLAVRVHDEDRVLDHAVLAIGVAAGDVVEPLCVLLPVAAKRDDVEDVVGAVNAIRRPVGEVVAIELDLVEEVVRVAPVGGFADGLAECCPGRLLDGGETLVRPRRGIGLGVVAVLEGDGERLSEPGEVLFVLRVADDDDDAVLGADVVRRAIVPVRDLCQLYLADPVVGQQQFGDWL